MNNVPQSLEFLSEYAPYLDELFYLSDASLSKDGHIAYSVRQYDPDTGGDTNRLWVLMPGKPAYEPLPENRQITSPRWCPQGARLAVIDRREGPAQLTIVDPRSGSILQRTDLAQGVSGQFTWSPDGRFIAFTTGIDNHEASTPLRYTSRAIYRLDGLGELPPAVTAVYLYDLEAGAVHQLWQDDCLLSGPAWASKDYEFLLRRQAPPQGHRDHAGIMIANLNGSRRIILNDWGMILSAIWIPGQQRILFIGRPFGSSAGQQFDLWSCNDNGQNFTCHSANLVNGVGGTLQFDMPVLWEQMLSPGIFPDNDGASALVTSQQGGALHVYRIAIDGTSSHETLLTTPCANILLDTTGSEALIAASSYRDPVRLTLLSLADSRETAVANLNSTSRRQLDELTVTPFHFRSAQEVEAWFLCKSDRRPLPTVLFVHGGPHLGFGNIFYGDVHLLTDAGFAVLIVNQRGSTGYGNDFANAVIGDWGHWDYLDLMAALDEAIKRGWADAARLACWGLSAGGFMSAWMITHTNRFRAAVVENPLVDWLSFYGTSDIGVRFSLQELGGHPHEIPEIYRRCSPITYVRQCKTPTLLIQGDADHRCPPGQSEQLYTGLKAAGCPAALLRLPGGSHLAAINGPPLLRKTQNQALLGWLNHYLKRVYLHDD